MSSLCQPSLFIFLVFLLLLAPWIFYFEIKHKGGLTAFPSLARAIADNPQTVTFTATLISNLLAIAMLYCFGVAVSYVFKAIEKGDVSAMRLSFYWALGSQSKPWPLFDIFYFEGTDHWVILWIMIMVYGLKFTLVPGINSLVAPVDITVSRQFQVSELDFQSSSADCVAWFNDNPAQNLTNGCTWNVSSDVCHSCQLLTTVTQTELPRLLVHYLSE